jgi:hypothetical protein
MNEEEFDIDGDSGVHVHHVSMSGNLDGSGVSVTRDGQTLDPADPSVRAMIDEMNAMAQEAEQNPKKKRRFSFKFKLGS